MSFNTSLIPVSAVDELSAKPLPPERSFCSLEGDNLVVSAVKKADRENAVILRLFEAAGRSAQTAIRFAGQERCFQAVNMLEENPGDEQNALRLAPYEISTVKLRAP